MPSASPRAGYGNDWVRAPWSCRVNRVATTEPLTSVTTAVTADRTASAYEIVSESATPSPSGEITAGSTCRPDRIGADGGGGAGTGPFESVPVAGRVSAPASIVQMYEPPLRPAEFHVQSTASPRPVPRATTAPPPSRTLTVQLRACESRAVNWIGPPSEPFTTGA